MFAEARLGVLVALGLSGVACSAAADPPATVPPSTIPAPPAPNPNGPPNFPVASCPKQYACVAESTAAITDPASTAYPRCHAALPGVGEVSVPQPLYLAAPGTKPIVVQAQGGSPFDADATSRARTGPNPSAGACCYSWTGPCMGGRPYRADGEARVAAPAVRSDWLSAVVATAPPDVRRRLADAWTRAAQAEHASIAAFNRFSLQLLAHGAPADLVAAAQRAAVDEVEHARLCFGLASAYAGVPVGPGPLALILSDATLLDLAVETFLDGCIEEGVSALVARESAARCADPVVRDVLLRLADDEQRHAELAWKTLAWALRFPGVADAVRSAIRVPTPAAPGDEGLAAWGRLGATVESEIRARAFAEVVVPCAAALLARADVGVRQDVESR